MNKILIIGAGAIGRGYVPWLFENAIINFADIDKNLIQSMKTQQFYKSFMTINNQYKEKIINLDKILDIGEINPEEINNYDFIITCVGPRNFLKLTDLFAVTDTTIICFENDRSLVNTMRISTNRNNIYFGIPDVISSNASNPYKKEWPNLSLITENGKTFVEAAAARCHPPVL